MNVVVPYEERLPLGRAHDVYVVRACWELAAAGHRVHLLVGRGTPDLAALFAHYGLAPVDGVTVHRLPLLRRARGVSWSAPFHAVAWWWIRRLEARGRADVLLPSTLKLAAFLRHRRGGAPLVYDLHELAALAEAPDVRRRRLEEAVLRAADGIVTTTAALAAAVRRIYAPRAPVHVVPLAVHRPRDLVPEPYPAAAAGPRRAGYVGQLYALQGVAVAIEAVASLGRAHLEVVGDGAERPALEALARRLGAAARVHFAGFVPPAALAPRLAAVDWLLLPALARGRMPYVSHMKCYDYLAYRRPVVASRLPAVSELLTDGETALLVPAGDAPALAAALARLEADAALARRLADGAWELGLRHAPEGRGARLARCAAEARARPAARAPGG